MNDLTQLVLPDWQLQDLRDQAAKMDDGQFVRDLGEIGRALCEADAKNRTEISPLKKTAEHIDSKLEAVLPFYMLLLKNSIQLHGEEVHLTDHQLAALLTSHDKKIKNLKPKLLLTSGQYGFALMQAAAALTDLDDAAAGVWYLSLKAILEREP